MADPVFFVDIGPDGAVAVHPRRLELPFLVAPIPPERKADDFNLLREPLVAIGCMMLPHRHFEFDSSFIGPEAESRFTKFATLMTKLKAQDDADPKRFPPVSVFGHADPTGTDEYNGPLSGRRALALYGVLTRNVKLWDTLHQNGYRGDQWGNRSIRRMLSISLQRPKGAEPEPPFFAGPTDDAPDAAGKAQQKKDTDDAIKAYKRARGASEPVSATMDAKTRAKLFAEYMDAICHDEAGDPFKLDPKTDFIARNKDATGHKGDVQGCGEFNPIFLLSKAEDELFAGAKELHEARDALYARNRRALVYIFRHGTQVTPKNWPCPVASNGKNASNFEPCKDRFWSDHKERRKLGEERRVFGRDMEMAVIDDDGNVDVDDTGHVAFTPILETGHTMACRFYQGFARYSPCEAGLKEWVVRFRIDGFTKPNEPAKPLPLANRRYVLEMGEARASATVRGALDAKGEIRIPVLDPRTRMTLRLDAWGALFEFPDEKKGDAKDPDPNALVDGKFPDEDKFMAIVLDAGALKKMRSDEDVDDLASRQRLYNLGFGPPNPAKWDREKDQVPAAKAYRESRKLPKDADLRDALEREHELEDVPPPTDPEDDPTKEP